MPNLRRHARGLLLGLLVCALELLSWSPGFGQASIVPLIQEVSVNRGGKAKFQLQVANRSPNPLSLTMQVYSLDISEIGVPQPVAGDIARSCRAWITLTPRTFELKPDSVQVVEGVIQAPVDAVGGYYAFITSEYVVPSEPLLLGGADKSKFQIDLGRAVSSSLLVTIRSSQNTVELKPDSLELLTGRGPLLSAAEHWGVANVGNRWQVILPIRNTGNTHTQAEGEVSIWTENARLIEKAGLTGGRGFVLPDKIRLFTAEGNKALADGTYMVRIQIRTREGKLVQGSFPYTVLKGKATAGTASESMRALIEASTPKFSLGARYLDYSITPGGTRTKGLTLTSHTSDTLTIYPRLVDWTLSDSGAVTLDPRPSEASKSCVPWITVTPNPIVIAPRRNASARVVVVAPPEIDGEYYGGVVFEASAASLDLPSELELARAALITVASSTDLKYEVGVKTFDHKPVSDMMRAFIVNVVNSGNAHCYVAGKVEIYDSAWKLATDAVTFGGTSDYVLPGKGRGYVVPCPGSLKQGKYEAVVEVECAEQAKPVIARINFYEN
jgi:hypothetical protein